jgi:AraC-like DNA-binding protein/CheY-like chemotaxis protein
MKNNVLLVDHDKEELDILSGYLNDTYELFTARNERTVMRTIETHSIHLIISSIELIDTDGSKLCAQLKSSAHYSHIPVILLLAGGAIPSRLKSLESGADAYIERPLSGEYIRAQIKNLIANRARIKDYFAHTLFAYTDARICSKTNEGFLNRLNDLISDHLPNPDLDVDLLARLMNMSRPTLYRKIKCISNLTPNELITIARLKRAAELISTADHKIFEVAKMVGFNSRSNFGKAFFKQFNVTPTAYQQLKKG